MAERPVKIIEFDGALDVGFGATAEAAGFGVIETGSTILGGQGGEALERVESHDASNVRIGLVDGAELSPGQKPAAGEHAAFYEMSVNIDDALKYFVLGEPRRQYLARCVFGKIAKLVQSLARACREIIADLLGVKPVVRGLGLRIQHGKLCH